jgi:bacteriocin biosynthesis cyclodehydratase domain-containing protein
VLPGIIGSLQANEALKLIAGYGDPLVGRLLTFDAQSTRFAEVKIRRDPHCPACGDQAEVAEPAAVKAAV